MTEQNKEQPEDRFAELRGFLGKSFREAKEQVGEGLDAASREARNTLKAGEKAAGVALDVVEKTVGKDRVIGAVLGAKVGGTIGLVGGVPGMIKGGFLGAAAGFVGGRKFIKWYRKDNTNDNKPDVP